MVRWKPALLCSGIVDSRFVKEIVSRDDRNQDRGFGILFEGIFSLWRNFESLRKEK